MILIDGTFSHFYIRFTHDLNKDTWCGCQGYSV